MVSAGWFSFAFRAVRLFCLEVDRPAGRCCFKNTVLTGTVLTWLTMTAECMCAGSMFFYVFRGQTSANAFSCDLKYGGAAYAATGRGYKLKVGCTCLKAWVYSPHVHMNKHGGCASLCS
jgi:hypothetical protein